MNQETMNRVYDDIESHLKAFHLPSMHVTALTGLLMADIVGPAIRAAVEAERDRCKQIVSAEAASQLELERFHTAQVLGRVADALD